MLTNPGVRANTLAELLALAKSEPGKIAFATDGPRNFSGMIAAWINKLGGTDIVQIPYATMPRHPGRGGRPRPDHHPGHSVGGTADAAAVIATDRHQHQATRTRLRRDCHRLSTRS